MKPRRLVTVACFFWAACATSPRAGASADCLREFNESFEHFDAVSRHRHLEGLQRADMECLFAAAKTGEAFNESFLAGPSHTARLQRFIGINSLAVGRRFEKHFARLPSGEWYGYNASALGRALESPGFFHVRFDADGSAIFGYADDFVGDFERQGLTSMFLATPGLEIRAIANNTGNLLFHDLVDTLRRVNPEVAVGTAERVADNQRALLSYFMIYRSPAPPPTAFQVDDDLGWHH